MDYQQEIRNVSKWIKYYLKESGAKGYVILISGGIDSSVVASLCCQSIGKENVIGISLPCESRKDMTSDAQELAKNLGIEFKTINLEKTYNAIVKALSEIIEIGEIAKENIKSRLRMVAGYGIANTMNYLVIGTGNKSEDTIGYFTKYGDGGVDLLPIFNFYKTEIYEIANLMPEIPKNIKTKKPSADLSQNQTDEEDIGMTYTEIDEILANLGTKKESKLNQENVNKIKYMIRKAEHKNNLPPRYERTIEKIPNQETIDTLEKAEKGIDIQSFNSVDELFKDLKK